MQHIAALVDRNPEFVSQEGVLIRHRNPVQLAYELSLSTGLSVRSSASSAQSGLKRINLVHGGLVIEDAKEHRHSASLAPPTVDELLGVYASKLHAYGGQDPGALAWITQLVEHDNLKWMKFPYLMNKRLVSLFADKKTHAKL